MRVQIELLKNHSDQLSYLPVAVTPARNVDPADGNFPSVEALEPAHAPRERTLARPAWADHAEHLALCDVEVNTPQHLVSAEGFA
jgi:hypothetical protein